MNVRSFIEACARHKRQSIERLRAYLDSRTPGQRLRIVWTLFLLFAIIDLFFIVRGFSAGGKIPSETLMP